jgi:uncharacterized tellurite resistance protein B-like protein
MGDEDDLEAFYATSTESVVEDSEKFRKKLNIGAEAFKYLTSAENLGLFTTTIASGTGLAGIATAGWFTSLGAFGQIGLAIGVISTPYGWIAAAGAGGAATVFATRWVFRRIKKGAVTETPNFINSPLDLLASSLCDLICPILLKIAHADENFCDQEREAIRVYFINEWGINPEYVENLLDYDEAHLDEYNWDTLSVTLQVIEKSGDLKYSVIAKEILNIANEVMLSDGITHPKELEEIQNLELALRKKSRFRTPSRKTNKKQKGKK